MDSLNNLTEIVGWKELRVRFRDGKRTEYEIIKHLLQVHSQSCQQCFGHSSENSELTQDTDIDNDNVSFALKDELEINEDTLMLQNVDNSGIQVECYWKNTLENKSPSEPRKFSQKECVENVEVDIKDDSCLSVPVEAKRKRGRPRKDRSVTSKDPPRTRNSPDSIDVSEIAENSPSDGNDDDDDRNDPDFCATPSKRKTPKKRGRPKKVRPSETLLQISKHQTEDVQTPAKTSDGVARSTDTETPQKRKRGRPRKKVQEHMASNHAQESQHSTITAEKHMDEREQADTTMKTIQPKTRNEKGMEDNPYPCPICDRTFQSQQGLNLHKGRHIKKGEVGNLEEESGTLECVLINGVKKIRHKCNVCGKTFKRSKSLRVHMINHKDPKDRPFQCQECGKGFACAFYLEYHSWTHTGQKRYMCNICGHRSSMLSNHQRHMQVHTHERPHTCPVCGRGLSSQRQLSVHLKSAHQQGQYRFTCEICGKGFMENHALQTHVRAHTDDNPYKCKICGEGCMSRNALEKHRMIAHKDPKFCVTYNCKICDKTFSKKSVYQKHQLVHTEERPINCDICHRKFKSNFHLKRHMERHRGKKPFFHCAICDSTFSRISSLRLHMRSIHDQEMPTSIADKYVCKICGENCKNLTEYERHRYESHQKTSDVNAEVIANTNSQGYSQPNPVKTQIEDIPAKIVETQDVFLPNLEPIEMPSAMILCTVCGAAFETAEQCYAHLTTHLSTS